MLQKPNQVLRKAKSGDKASEEEYFDSLALMINTIAKSFKYADFLGVSEELINRSSKKAYKQILESSKKNIEESSRDFNKKFKEGFIEVIESYVSLKARTDAQKEMLINKYIEYNIEEIYNPMNATEELKKIAIKLKLFDYSSPYNIYTLLENKKEVK